MGRMLADELASGQLDITPEQGMTWHLQGNFYPPIPVSMVEPCLASIQAFWEDDLDREIPMPEGVSYKGRQTAPARAIIEQHRLESWCQDEFLGE